MSNRLPADWIPPHLNLYSYLLGIYLGDGTITRHGQTSVGLHIYLDKQYPGIEAKCSEAMRSIFGSKIGRYERPNSGCVRLSVYDQTWPNVFPQAGPGKKHDRPIYLADWQQLIADQFPKELMTGLIHSDGCRCLNTFTVKGKNGSKEYSYPRYFFTNYSIDIQGIFTGVCDRLGIRWSRSNWRNISISHRDSVAILDSFIGPKS